MGGDQELERRCSCERPLVRVSINSCHTHSHTNRTRSASRLLLLLFPLILLKRTYLFIKFCCQELPRQQVYLSPRKFSATEFYVMNFMLLIAEKVLGNNILCPSMSSATILAKQKQSSSSNSRDDTTPIEYMCDHIGDENICTFDEFIVVLLVVLHVNGTNHNQS